ncbi:hypothetical protein BGM26_13755 [Bacillus sp. FJAT-29790]|uniref:hypothetical protein n=1 Tax=Bacillus sp. FJAT-29790 TaxID=1895002 RepID=UPI001C22A200|nr:hypothetical protein [Bacillus sp. FJAT-29790]MBU8880042.1 hypothetical protein [Bacillus sp. FJAT-29790]
MAICPICNGFEKINAKCSVCGKALSDNGRIMDYYGNYSPYMPIDQLKLADGYPTDYTKKECPHLLKCVACGHDEVKFIKE